MALYVTIARHTSPRTQIVSSVLALSGAWAAGFCRFLYGRGSPCTDEGLGEADCMARVDKGNSSSSTMLPTPGWLGPLAAARLLRVLGSSVCRPVFARVLGRFCLCTCLWSPEPSCSPGLVTLQMMSGFWDFHLLCGRYLLDSPQPWLWDSYHGVCGVSSVSRG